MSKSVIVACDFSEKSHLIEFLNRMEGADENLICKVGMELFYAGVLHGFNPIEIIKARGYKVFLDLKLKDIPNTISRTMTELVEAGVDMINLHADGGLEMMKAARKAVDEAVASRDSQIQHYIDSQADNKYHSLRSDALHYPQAVHPSIPKKLHKPLLLGVTVLTSMNSDDLESIGINTSPARQVRKLAKMAQKAGLDGVVCSSEEIRLVKDICGEPFITVTPGIRYQNAAKDDQSRVATPTIANMLGSDYIVVGRPITQASDPLVAYQRFYNAFTGRIEDMRPEDLKYAKYFIENLDSQQNSSNNAARAILDAGCITFDFQNPYLLKSGLASPIYCDNRTLYNSHSNKKIVVEALEDLVTENFPEDVVYIGTPMSGIPYATSVADALHASMGFTRDHEKNHGKGGKVEPKLSRGTKVVIIEDLVTTGESVLEVVSALQDAGLEVVGIVSIVRNNAVQLKQEFIDLNIPYKYVTDMNLITKMALEQGRCSKEEYEAFLRYSSNPQDESWMSDDARYAITQKRLAREAEKAKENTGEAYTVKP